jgi:uncharacterized protein (DUF4415 family)
MAKKQPPLTDKNGEVRELTAADMKAMRPIQEAAPEVLKLMQREKAKRQRGRPKVTAPRVLMALRLEPKLARDLKGLGKGYTTRIERVLSEALKDGKI